MSDTTSQATAETVEASTDGAPDTTPAPPKPAETVEFWKQKAREQEKRAKENADAAKRLADIEESQKSEAQKQADRLAELEKDAAAARTEALRLRVATKHGISDEDADLFLTGSDEETLTRQAQRLAERVAQTQSTNNISPHEGNNPRPAGDDRREFVRRLTGRD